MWDPSEPIKLSPSLSKANRKACILSPGFTSIMNTRFSLFFYTSKKEIGFHSFFFWESILPPNPENANTNRRGLTTKARLINVCPNSLKEYLIMRFTDIQAEDVRNASFQNDAQALRDITELFLFNIYRGSVSLIIDLMVCKNGRIWSKTHESLDNPPHIHISLSSRPSRTYQLFDSLGYQ